MNQSKNNQSLIDIQVAVLDELSHKLRYEFEGPRDADSIEEFIDDFEAELRLRAINIRLDKDYKEV